jgi:hypothetical protein
VVDCNWQNLIFIELWIRQNMKEKIFLKRGPRVGKAPSSSSSSLFQFRNLVKFGIILLFWIAFIPLLWHQKTKNTEDKSTAKVVKEIPKTQAPAASVEEKAVPRETLPTAPVVTESTLPAQPEEKPGTPPPGATVGQPREPVGGRSEDQGKPPIGPVPESRPALPVPGSLTAAPGLSGEASAQKPAGLSQAAGVSKPKAVAAAPAAKPKPGETAASAAKPKPGTTAGAGSTAAGAKPLPPKTQQARAATDPTKVASPKPPASIASNDRRPTSAVPPAKPIAAGTPATAPGTPPAPSADKVKDSISGVNWVYVVHLGSFQNASQAQELQKKLQKKGYAVVVKSQQNLQKGRVHNVELKGMRDAGEAKDKLNKLQSEEQVNGVLLKVAEGR